MALVSTQVTVTNAATKIITGDVGCPMVATIRVVGADIAISTGTTAAATGLVFATSGQIQNGGSFDVILDMGESLWGITAAGSAIVHVLAVRSVQRSS